MNYFIPNKSDAQTRIFYFEYHINVHIEKYTNVQQQNRAFSASLIIFLGADWLTIYVPLASKLNSL